MTDKEILYIIFGSVAFLFFLKLIIQWAVINALEDFYENKKYEKEDFE